MLSFLTRVYRLKSLLRKLPAGLALSRAVLILPCISDMNLRNTRVISRERREQCPNPELMKPHRSCLGHT